MNSESAWDYAKGAADKASGSGAFLRYTDGEAKEVVFDGPPHVRKTHWAATGVTECTETETCPECRAGNRASTRMLVNVYVVAEGTKRIFEGSSEWFRTLLQMRDKYGLDKWTFEMKRLGSGLETKYTILPEQQIDDELRARVAKAPRHELASMGKGRAGAPAPAARVGAEGAPKTVSGAAAFVDVATATEIAEQLRQIPRSEVDAFFAAFKIARVRELRVGDVREARAHLARVLATQDAPAEEPEPFF